MAKEKRIYLQQGNESYATNHRHLQELHRLSAFQQETTKVPPSYDGRGSWFAYEDAIDDWCDITELDSDKRGPALRNRLEGEAAIHKRLLDRERLKDPDNGVKYFKSFLRPLFVKGAANVFLYRFQQFMNLHRGSGDMLRWITRFQLSIQSKDMRIGTCPCSTTSNSVDWTTYSFWLHLVDSEFAKVN